jgi:hypothetical protein
MITGDLFWLIAGVLLLSGGLGLGVATLYWWRQDNYTPPKRKRRSTYVGR